MWMLTPEEQEAVRALIETIEEQLEKLPDDSVLRSGLLKDRAALIDGMGERRLVSVAAGEDR